MSDRTLAIVVGTLVWLLGVAALLLGLFNDLPIVWLAGVLVALPGGLLSYHGRRLPRT